LATTPTEATKTIQKNVGRKPSPQTSLTCRQIDSFMALMFSEKPETWRNHFCPHDKARQWITSNQQGPLNKKMTKEASSNTH
jgi:hypothetical protein